MAYIACQECGEPAAWQALPLMAYPWTHRTFVCGKCPLVFRLTVADEAPNATATFALSTIEAGGDD